MKGASKLLIENISITNKVKMTLKETDSGNTNLSFENIDETTITLYEISLLRDTLTRYLRKRRKG